MNEMTVPTRYAHALAEALRGALGAQCEIDDVVDCGTRKTAPRVQFVATGLDRDITERGFGEVFFIEERAGNDNGWCEGDAVLLLATAAGAAVLDLWHGCPEYCDDQTDASMSGTATFFDDAGLARAFARHRADRMHFSYCKSAMESALLHGLRIDAGLAAQALLDAARNLEHPRPDLQRDGWLSRFCNALATSLLGANSQSCGQRCLRAPRAPVKHPPSPSNSPPPTPRQSHRAKCPGYRPARVCEIQRAAVARHGRSTVTDGTQPGAGR